MVVRAYDPHRCRRAAPRCRCCEDRVRKIGPAGFAPRGHVEDATQVATTIGYQIGSHLDDAIGDRQRAGGITDLIADYAQFVAVGGETQHGLDEIAAERAVDPGDA